MNIFALSSNPHDSAKMMLDKHVVKMPTETCQMLHTNLLYKQYVHVYGEEPELKDLKAFHLNIGSKLMKPAMLNHPSTIWARQSIGNFHWLYLHGVALCEEYSHRYGKKHGSYDRIHDCNEYEVITFRHDYPVNGLTPVIIAMADKYRLDYDEWEQQNPNCNGWDFVIDSYRHYYLEGKWEFATWKTKSPDWWPENHYDNMMAKKVEAFNQTYNAKLEEEE